MHPDQRLGRYISDRRRYLNLSQARLAQALGRNRSYIVRVERGQTLSPYLLPKAANVLGVSLDKLINPPM